MQRLGAISTWRSRVGAISAALLLATVGCLAIAPTASAAGRAPAARPAEAPVPPPSPPALPEQPEWAPQIHQLYNALLNRDPDPGGLTYWGNVMGFLSALAKNPAVGATYVSAQLVRSPGSTDPLVNAAFTTLLGRSPEPAAVAGWSAFLQGHSVEQMWAAIVGFPEFTQKSPSLQAQAIYRLVLGRSADSGGETFWTNYLKNGGSPSLMVTQFTRSAEYAVKTVTAVYEKALFRAPDPGGLFFWAVQLVNGASDQLSLLTTLAGTTESVDYGCDPNQTAACLLPYPNNLYTVPDPSTATGLRVAVKPSWTPTNAGGAPINPQEINRSDGFSPGAATILQVPGLDLAKTGAPTVDQPKTSLAPDSPIVVFDENTGARVPVWAELDQFNNPGPNPTLFIRPAVNYTEGHTYVVVLRNLKTSANAAIAAPPVFAAYRDGTDLPGVAGFEANKPRMARIFNALQGQSISNSGLYMAWDFTVASTANITGRLLQIRNDAFTRLGGNTGLTNDAAPQFTVTSVAQRDPNDPNSTDPYPGIARVVQGTFQVPSYLTGDGGPGSVFNTGPDGLPQYTGNSITAQFDCIVPSTALVTPGIPSIYGHGLFGSMTEVESGPQRAMATNYNRIYCATPWIGMSQDDLPTAAQILQDLSKFDELTDRTQQGILDMLFLGRLMNSPNGFNTNAAFQNSAKQGVMLNHELTYDGNSQGGILGGITTAVATDFTRAVLGVSAMNFSTLMDRSSDFAPFFAFFNVGYPNRLNQVIAVDLIQGQWDRSEPDGYMAHVTNNPLPNTPSHHVLQQLAYGDFQVSNWASDVEARTVGRDGGNMEAECPPTVPERAIGDWPLWDVPCITAYPYDGSAVVYLDSGSAPPPLGNVAPTTANGNRDPHGDPRSFGLMQMQKDQFLRPNGMVIDACANVACQEPAP